MKLSHSGVGHVSTGLPHVEDLTIVFTTKFLNTLMRVFSIYSLVSDTRGNSTSASKGKINLRYRVSNYSDKFLIRMGLIKKLCRQPKRSR